MEYIILFMLVLLIMIFLKMKSQVDKINRLNKYLYLEKNPTKYIEHVNTILSKKQSNKNIIINNIQKTTGLFYAGKFQEVIDLTGQIKKVPKNWEPIYYQNIILSLFFMGEKTKAEETFQEAKPIFDEFKSNNYYKEFIEIVYGTIDFSKGKDTKKYFADLAETGANDYRKAFGHYILGKINKMENNIDEANNNFNEAKKLGKGSFIEEFSSAE